MPKTISFSKQRRAFADNLKAILTKLDYSVITFSLKLNSLLGEHASTLVSTTNVNEWINNEKLPNLYLLTKIGALLNTTIDNLLSPEFSIDNFNGRSFSKGISAVVSNPTTINKSKPAATKPAAKENKNMSNSTPVITVSSKRLSALRQAARERTNSKTVNYLLMEKIQSYGMLKTLVEKTGISDRSYRDYQYDQTPVTPERMEIMTRELGTTARALGFYLNKEEGLYRSATIKATK